MCFKHEQQLDIKTGDFNKSLILNAQKAEKPDTIKFINNTLKKHEEDAKKTKKNQN